MSRSANMSPFLAAVCEAHMAPDLTCHRPSSPSFCRSRISISIQDPGALLASVLASVVSHSQGLRAGSPGEGGGGEADADTDDPESNNAMKWVLLALTLAHHATVGMGFVALPLLVPHEMKSSVASRAGKAVQS